MKGIIRWNWARNLSRNLSRNPRCPGFDGEQREKSNGILSKGEKQAGDWGKREASGRLEDLLRNTIRFMYTTIIECHSIGQPGEEYNRTLGGMKIYTVSIMMKIKGNEEGTSNDSIYCEGSKKSVRILIHFADSSLSCNNIRQWYAFQCVLWESSLSNGTNNPTKHGDICTVSIGTANAYSFRDRLSLSSSTCTKLE